MAESTRFFALLVSLQFAMDDLEIFICTFHLSHVEDHLADERYYSRERTK